MMSAKTRSVHEMSRQVIVMNSSRMIQVPFTTETKGRRAMWVGEARHGVARVVDSRIETALVVCLNSASAALVIAASDSDTRSVEVVDLGME